MDWKPDQIEIVKKLTEDGLSAQKIGDVFGVTRNSIIGLWHRNKIKVPDKPHARRAVPRPKKVYYVKKEKFYKPAPPPPEAPPQLRIVAQVPMNVTLMELAKDGCHYIAGDDHLYCGHKVTTEGSYCDAHREIMYTKQMPRTGPRYPMRGFRR